SRISLISRSDIRYVGILHEINSENSTIALEKVVSYGTEGRHGDPAKEIPATDNVYEYIVFRGSDVKDLRIEEQAKPQQPKPPQVPDNPAILQASLIFHLKIQLGICDEAYQIQLLLFPECA
ncbi:Scd6-like Sm domain-containing protein, partial [Kalaharituber pfeilii]